MLRKVLRFGRVPESPKNQVHHWLLVLLDQLLKSIAIALLHAQHQGGIWVRRIDHSTFNLSKTGRRTRLRETTWWRSPNFLRTSTLRFADSNPIVPRKWEFTRNPRAIAC